MKTIEIIDSGQDKYTLKRDTNILGRRYDNLAETITIVKPAAEVDSACVLVATYGGNVVDHIAVRGDTIEIKSNLSQYESINIGFSFSRPDGYVKGSEIKQFKFLPAPKPDGFVPVPSEQKATIDYLAQYGFVDAVLDNNILKFKNYNGDDVKEVQLSGFVQEQSDWNETNDKSETYIKNKPTKLSQFENDLNLEVQDASTTQKGIIQIATDDDIAAGTNETKAVTPKQLKNASSGGINLENSSFQSIEGIYDLWTPNEGKAVGMGSVDLNAGAMEMLEVSNGAMNGFFIDATAGTQAEFHLTKAGELNIITYDGNDTGVISIAQSGSPNAPKYGLALGYGSHNIEINGDGVTIDGSAPLTEDDLANVGTVKSVNNKTPDPTSGDVELTSTDLGLGADLLNWKGDFAQMTAYKKDDVVLSEQILYVCLNDYLAFQTAPANDATNWRPLTFVKQSDITDIENQIGDISTILSSVVTVTEV